MCCYPCAGFFRYVDNGNTPTGTSEASALAAAPIFFTPGALLLGDSAYRHDARCMCPYVGADLQGPNGPAHRSFGRRLSNQRIRVEHAFSRVKHTWRLLESQWQYSLDRLPKTFRAACLLANFLHVERKLYS